MSKKFYGMKTHLGMSDMEAKQVLRKTIIISLLL